jgi:hypothetical protein
MGFIMLNLTDEKIIEYFKKSYTAADGFWFMKTEEKYDFDTALELDAKVWEVMPKIQARMLKPLADSGNKLKDLMECLETKFSLEDFTFTIEDNTDSGNFSIIISSCPWHNLMVTSKRENLSAKIGALICEREYQVWANEFGADISYKLYCKICNGDEQCILLFSL